MWQRFTERARKVIFYAQEEAGALGENYVSTEHLLLGLVRENDSVAARILDRLGVQRDQIRLEIMQVVARGDGRTLQDMQLTPRAKRVIDLAYREAHLLGNNYIGTEHILLGLIGEGDGLAGRVLTKLAVDLDSARDVVRHIQEGGVEAGPRRGTTNSTTANGLAVLKNVWRSLKKPDSDTANIAPPVVDVPLTPRCKRALAAAQATAAAAGAAETSVEHLASSILAEPGAAVRVLAGVGVDVGTITDGVLKLPKLSAAPGSGEFPPLSEAAAAALAVAKRAAHYILKDARVQTDHILLALTSSETEFAEAFTMVAVDPGVLLAEMMRMRTEET